MHHCCCFGAQLDAPSGAEITEQVTSRLQRILRETSGNVLDSALTPASQGKRGAALTPANSQKHNRLSSSSILGGRAFSNLLLPNWEK